MINNLLNKAFLKDNGEHISNFETMYLHVTKQCNLNCSYCYYNAGEKEDFELSSSEIKKMLNELSTLKPKRIVFTGGEPLLREDIFELANCIKSLDKKIILGISTNGTLINEYIAYKLVNAFSEIRISIDGPQEVNDSLRGLESFNKAMKAFKFIIEAEGSPSAFITASTMNLSHLKDFMNNLLSIGVKKIHVSPLKQIGRATDKNLSCDLTELRKIVEQFYFEKFGLKMKHQPSESLNCGVGKFISISSDGSVYPCHVLSIPEFCLGNIKNERLSNIINNSLIIYSLRNSKFNEISNCNICLSNLPK